MTPTEIAKAREAIAVLVHIIERFLDKEEALREAPPERLAAGMTNEERLALFK